MLGIDAKHLLSPLGIYAPQALSLSDLEPFLHYSLVWGLLTDGMFSAALLAIHEKP